MLWYLVQRTFPDSLQIPMTECKRSPAERRSVLVPVALVLAVGLVLAGVFAPRLAAQDATPAPAVTRVEASPGFFVETFAVAPSARAPGQTVYVTRATVLPGTEVAPHRHPGTTVLAVESGRFGWTLVEGTAHLVRGAGTSGTTVEDVTTPNTELILEPGDAMYYDDDVVHTARGASDEPTILMGTFILETGQPFTIPVDIDMSATPAA
jgi:hypothetical protein